MNTSSSKPMLVDHTIDKLSMQQTTSLVRAPDQISSKGASRLEVAGKWARDYTMQLQEDLKDPTEAAAYIEAAILEGDRDSLLTALRQVAAANGGMASIAEQTGLSRESLNRALGRRGNPTVSTLSRVLAAAGLRLHVQPV